MLLRPNATKIILVTEVISFPAIILKTEITVTKFSFTKIIPLANIEASFGWDPAPYGIHVPCECNVRL